MVRELVRDLPTRTTVVSGGAIGPDSWAADEAVKCGLRVLVHIPNWKKYGKAAGPIRNQAMANDADVLFAFWDGKSKGTYDMIFKMRKAGKYVEIIQ